MDALPRNLSRKKVWNMSQVLSLEKADRKLRRLIESFREQQEECVIQDEQERPVAVVLPIDRYESYRAYLRQRKEDFTVFDRIDVKMKGHGPDFIEVQIEKAVAEAKAKAETQKIDT